MDIFADCGGVKTNIINCSGGGNGITDVLCLAVSIFMVAVGILVAIGIVIVGLQYLTARDNEEQVRKSKRRLFHIVIGVAVYILMWPLVNWLLPNGMFACSGNGGAGDSGTSESAGSSNNSSNNSGGSSYEPGNVTMGEDGNLRIERPASEILP